MKCSEVKKVLKNNSDAEISADSGLISHVKSCGACSEKFGFILKLSLATAQNKEMRLPFDFEDRVWDKIGEPNPSFSFFRNMLSPKWAITAAAALVLLFAGLPLINKNSARTNINEAAVKVEISEPGGTHKQKDTHPGEAVKIVNNEPGISVSENIIVHKSIKIQEPVSGLKQIQQDNLAITSHNPAPASVYKAGGNAQPSVKISAAGIDPVQKELTASYSKVEDEIKGDVAVFGSVFRPASGESVTVKYRVKNTGDVVLIVYDRRGKVIKRVYSGKREPGVYSESWKGTGDDGAPAGSGIYIMYLKTDSAENKIKIGIIK